MDLNLNAAELMFAIGLAIAMFVFVMGFYYSIKVTRIQRLDFLSKFDINGLRAVESKNKPFEPLEIIPVVSIKVEDKDRGCISQYYQFMSYEEAEEAFKASKDKLQKMLKNKPSATKKLPRAFEMPNMYDALVKYKEFAIQDDEGIARIILVDDSMVTIESNLREDGRDMTLSIQRYLGF